MRHWDRVVDSFHVINQSAGSNLTLINPAATSSVSKIVKFALNFGAVLDLKREGRGSDR